MLFENADYISIWILSVAIICCLIIGILSCVCGCRKRIPKNELLGLAGLVKITNPDENVNFNTTHNIQLNSFEVVNEDQIKSEDHDSNKRGSSTVANATRSLPDLPVDSGDTSEKLWSNTENNVDTNSDLYATVEDANRKKRALTTCLTVDSSYTPSQTDDSLSPYARLKGEHSYDQLQQNEHPYAQVGTTSSDPVPSTSHDAPHNSSPSSCRTTERERADSTRSKSPSIGGEQAAEEIPAASAIAGSIPANQELPYMTPPIPQQHFSGDSQDSGKGYTSISVREPLARILGRSRDPHYATVSDDSDEMYAAIEERNTSGSETYAQISPPPALLPLVLHHQQSIDGRSVSSEESPRRERRPANSPLPEVPHVDEMYAKVVKKRSPDQTSLPSPTTSEAGPSGSPLAEKPSPSFQPSPPIDSDPKYQSLTDPKYQSLTDPNYQTVPDTDYQTVSDPMYQTVSDPNYQTVSDPNYQTVPDPNYQTVPDPNYQTVPDPNYCSLTNAKYESAHNSSYQPTLDSSGQPTADPNYEELHNHDYASLSRRYEHVYPNYESVESQDPPYERVEIPDYETVLRRDDDRIPPSVLELYAQVNKSPDKSEKL